MDPSAPLEEPMLKDQKPLSIVEDHLQETPQELGNIPPPIPVALLLPLEGSFLYEFCADPAVRRRNIEEHMGMLGQAFDETPAGSQILIGAKQPKCQNFQGNTQKSPTIEFIPAVDLSCEPLSHDFILFPSSKASSQGVCARIDNSSQCAASRICRISAKSALSSIISLEAEASDRSNAIITTMDRALIDFHGIGTWMEVLIAIVPDINEDADLHENLTLSGEGAIP